MYVDINYTNVEELMATLKSYYYANYPYSVISNVYIMRIAV